MKIYSTATAKIWELNIQLETVGICVFGGTITPLETFYQKNKDKFLYDVIIDFIKHQPGLEEHYYFFRNPEIISSEKAKELILQKLKNRS